MREKEALVIETVLTNNRLGQTCKKTKPVTLKGRAA
jgi:hypothetical protein